LVIVKPTDWVVTENGSQKRVYKSNEFGMIYEALEAEENIKGELPSGKIQE
jgi:hypothetical protein